MFKRRMSSHLMVIISLLALVALIAGTWSSASGAGLLAGGSPIQTAAQGSSVIPTISITSVRADQTVTIQTRNFPANDTFNVLMNTIGTKGVGGVQVGAWSSGPGGTQLATFNIPASLQGQRMIAIRLQSPTSGYFSYNWFYNNTSGSIPDTGATATPSRPIPTFTITGVVRGQTVTIETKNFPANDNFNVLMNNMGTKGVDGTSAGTWNSGPGGTQTATFTIPAAFANNNLIAIRLESPSSGYFAYNWFFNNTTSGGVPDTGATPTPGGPTPTPGPTSTPARTPTFTIVSVVRDQTVTIRTNNFPANDTFNVLMNEMGTRGVGGTQVGTYNSGNGDPQTVTFNIPDSVKGDQQIAIRLESPTSGFFSYNWFYNSTTP